MKEHLADHGEYYASIACAIIAQVAAAQHHPVLGLTPAALYVFGFWQGLTWKRLQATPRGGE